jgi:TonB family protein
LSVRVVLVPRSLSVPPRYLLSALAHALILVVWAWAPTRTTRFEFKGDAMTVGLVAAPPSGGGTRAVLPPAPTPPAPAPPPPEPKGPSLQDPKAEEPKKPPDKKKKEEKKPASDAVPEAPSNGPSGPPSDAPAPPSAPGSGAGGAGAPGTTLSLGGGQPGSDFYSAMVRAAIEPRWRKPVLDGATSEVTVGFEILRDGTVRDVQVVRPSGIPALDRSAMRAVIEASPLPPFPAGWRGASTPATMTFILLPE